MHVRATRKPPKNDDCVDIVRYIGETSEEGKRKLAFSSFNYLVNIVSCSKCSRSHI